MTTIDEVRQLRDRAEEYRTSAEQYTTLDGREWGRKVANSWEHIVRQAERELAREERRA